MGNSIFYADSISSISCYSFSRAEGESFSLSHVFILTHKPVIHGLSTKLCKNIHLIWSTGQA